MTTTQAKRPLTACKKHRHGKEREALDTKQSIISEYAGDPESETMPDTRGALRPAASRAMQMQATRAFHTMLPDKMNLSIIIVIIVMQPVCLCRRTPFMMISSLHVTEVMMLNMIMTTRRGCGSLRNLYASAVGHLS